MPLTHAVQTVRLMSPSDRSIIVDRSNGRATPARIAMLETIRTRMSHDAESATRRTNAIATRRIRLEAIRDKALTYKLLHGADDIDAVSSAILSDGSISLTARANGVLDKTTGIVTSNEASDVQPKRGGTYLEIMASLTVKFSKGFSSAKNSPKVRSAELNIEREARLSLMHLRGDHSPRINRASPFSRMINLTQEQLNAQLVNTPNYDTNRTMKPFTREETATPYVPLSDRRYEVQAGKETLRYVAGCYVRTVQPGTVAEAFGKAMSIGDINKWKKCDTYRVRPFPVLQPAAKIATHDGPGKRIECRTVVQLTDRAASAMAAQWVPDLSHMAHVPAIARMNAIR